MLCRFLSLGRFLSGLKCVSLCVPNLQPAVALLHTLPHGARNLSAQIRCFFRKNGTEVLQIVYGIGVGPD